MNSDERFTLSTVKGNPAIHPAPPPPPENGLTDKENRKPDLEKLSRAILFITGGWTGFFLALITYLMLWELAGAYDFGAKQYEGLALRALGCFAVLAAMVPWAIFVLKGRAALAATSSKWIAVAWAGIALMIGLSISRQLFSEQLAWLSLPINALPFLIHLSIERRRAVKALAAQTKP